MSRRVLLSSSRRLIFTRPHPTKVNNTLPIIILTARNNAYLTATPRYCSVSQARFLSSAAAHAEATKETFLPIEQVTERVMNVIKSFPKVDARKVTPKANFMTDLGLDSLDTVELVMMFEEEFVLQIPDDQADKILTCEDAVTFISRHPQAR